MTGGFEGGEGSGASGLVPTAAGGEGVGGDGGGGGGSGGGGGAVGGGLGTDMSHSMTADEREPSCTLVYAPDAVQL